MNATTTRIILLGKTGYGKSSLANTILGEEVFMTNHTPESGTRECKAETRSVHGRSITMIDTPGFFDTDMSEDKLKAEIVRCIVECACGPYAFLILLKVEKFSEHEENIIKKVEEYFGEDFNKFATLVFTHGDQLQEGQKIEDFLCKKQSLMKKFAGRCHVVDNKYWSKENPEDEYRSNKFQVEQLLQSVDEIMKINKGCFTNEMLRKVGDALQEERERIRSSSENMSQEKIEERAKQSVVAQLLILFMGTTTGVLLGALMGVKIMVTAVGKLITKWKMAAKATKELETALAEVQAISGRGGPGAAVTAGGAGGGAAVTAGGAAVGAAVTAVTAVTAGGEAGAAGGAVLTAMAMSAVVGGAAGGVTGYSAAKDAETPLEGMKKAAEAVKEGADKVLEIIEKSLTD